MFHKPENYIEPTDLLKNLHSMYEDPDQLMVKGVIDNDTNMLKRENITTLLSYILLVHSNTVQNRTFAIWKYSTPKEGDGRIDIIENRNNFSLIKSSLNIEQVYIKNNSPESTTEALIVQLLSKNNKREADRSNEVLCIFVDKDSTNIKRH